MVFQLVGRVVAYRTSWLLDTCYSNTASRLLGGCNGTAGGYCDVVARCFVMVLQLVTPFGCRETAIELQVVVMALHKSVC